MSYKFRTAEQTINRFYLELSKAWDEEPELLIELGITDEVYNNVMNWHPKPTDCRD